MFFAKRLQKLLKRSAHSKSIVLSSRAFKQILYLSRDRIPLKCLRSTSLPCLGAAHVHAGEIVVPQVPAGGPRQAHVIPTHMLHNIRIDKIIKDMIRSYIS